MLLKLFLEIIDCKIVNYKLTNHSRLNDGFYCGSQIKFEIYLNFKQLP